MLLVLPTISTVSAFILVDISCSVTTVDYSGILLGASMHRMVNAVFARVSTSDVRAFFSKVGIFGVVIFLVTESVVRPLCILISSCLESAFTLGMDLAIVSVAMTGTKMTSQGK